VKAGAELKVAACQMKSVDSIEANKNQIRMHLKSFESRESRVQLVSFPENSLYFRIKPQDQNPGIQKSDEFLNELADWAKKFQTVVHLGSVALKTDSAKLKNASVWIDQNAKISFPYSKIHLFDVDVDGEKPVRESDYFEAGEKPCVVEINGFKIGLSICYDLRFAELYLQYAKLKVDAILIPSAFLVTTGRAHWHSLMRARAIESQAYVIAAAQGGLHATASGETRSTYGHSLIVDPWGEVVAEVQDSEQNFITHIMSQKMIAKVRSQIPMHHHRKL
jgi:predicted amidohydrolase